MRSIRARADALNLGYEHFVGQRGWTEDRLRAAIAEARDWDDVLLVLGRGGPAARVALRGHASRLGIEYEHLERPSCSEEPHDLVPSAERLPRAGTMIAAAWFTLCGADVAWPMEPCRYDLLVRSDGRTRRVQVKTTTVRTGASWKVYLSTTGRDRRTYDPGEIDDFFVVDADLQCYLIPIEVVGGLHAIHLSAYAQYRVAAFRQGLQAT